MGYRMEQIGSEFTIRAEKKAAALAALKAAAKRAPIYDSSGHHFLWVDMDEYLNAWTLEEALKAWRWVAFTAENGDISEISFAGENLGDEDVLFEVIGPFVEPGGCIEMLGGDGKQWRWRFDGERMREQTARLVWDD